MKRLIASLLIMIMLATTCIPVYASDGETAPVSEQEKAKETISVASFEIKAKSGILMDDVNGTILYDKNSHEKMPPASITKIMTMLLVMEALDSSKIKLEDMVTVSSHAASMGGTQIWLEENEQMTVNDLLKACAINSANDAAMALAEHIGGSEEGFVAMMNNKAVELKMNDTTFINPTGLDAKGHLSSAYDIALMSKELLKHKNITNFTSIYMDSLRGGKTELVNTNKLVRFYKGCTGLKTGTTDGAGCCVSVSATKNNMGLISVVMGSSNSKDRFQAAKQLLDYGFSNFSVYTPKISNDVLKPVKVLRGISDTVDIGVDNTSSIIILKGREKNIVQNNEIASDVEAPVLEGQKLGEITLTIDDEEIAKFTVKAKSEIKKITMLNAFGRLASRYVKM